MSYCPEPRTEPTDGPTAILQGVRTPGDPMNEPSLDSLAAQFLSPAARLEAVLAETAAEVQGLRALVVGDARGLPVVSLARGPKTLATTAMATLAMTAAAKVTASLALPEPEDIVIEAGAWVVLVHAIGNGCTLTAVVSSEMNLGLMSLTMKTRGREIRELLDDMT